LPSSFFVIFLAESTFYFIENTPYFKLHGTGKLEREALQDPSPCPYPYPLVIVEFPEEISGAVFNF